MWHEGTIGVPKGNDKYTVVHYWVKAYDEGSQYGIGGGRISKATLKISGEVTPPPFAIAMKESDTTEK